ncbi:hypothetical protein [Dactylosporangium sp. NPDC051541]|uniref:hypothetical protein n=1 Tax=Dactylosporangium sp. NPDC051541 TaxID=3363977 RepID=UPI003791FBE2
MPIVDTWPRSLVRASEMSGGVAGTAGAVAVASFDGALAAESPAPVCATTVTACGRPASAPNTHDGVAGVADVDVVQVAPGRETRAQL